MNLQDKINAYKKIAKDGDIILFSGQGFLSDAIKDLTNSHWSHSAVVRIINGELWVVQSTINKIGNGVQLDTLENEIQGDIDFAVLRPMGFTLIQINAALLDLEDKIAEHTKYNKLFYLQFLLYKFFKWDDKHITQKNAEVCSQAVQVYTDALPIPAYQNIAPIVPESFWSNRPGNVEILIDKG